MAGGSYSVRSVAAAIGTESSQIIAARGVREGLLIQNLGAGDLYVGGSDVSTANGIKIAAGESWANEFISGPVHGISSAGTLDVRVLEVY